MIYWCKPMNPPPSRWDVLNSLEGIIEDLWLVEKSKFPYSKEARKEYKKSLPEGQRHFRVNFFHSWLHSQINFFSLSS